MSTKYFMGSFHNRILRQFDKNLFLLLKWPYFLSQNFFFENHLLFYPRKEIKENKPDYFAIFDVDKLWKVNIPLDENDKLNILKIQPCAEFEG